MNTKYAGDIDAQQTIQNKRKCSKEVT